MKKSFKFLFVTIIFTLVISPCISQGVYVKINGGYGFPAGTQTAFKTESNAISQIINVENVKISLGKGINFAGAIGGMFNKNLGAELNIGYLIGGATERSEVTNAGSNKMEDIDKISSKMLFFTPALVVESGFEKINPYAKFGLIIGMAKYIEEYTSTEVYGGTTDKSYEKTEYKMDLGLGANAALGLMFNISENFGIFAECNANLLSINPKSSEITESTINGVDMLNHMTTSEKEIEYENELTIDPTVTPSENEPSKDLKQKRPFSSVGANIGIKISF